MAFGELILRSPRQASSVAAGSPRSRAHWAMKEPLCEGEARAVVTIVWDAEAGHLLQTWPTATEFSLDGGDVRPLYAAEFEQHVVACWR